MSDARRRFVPAAGIDALLFLYDPLQRWLMREQQVKRALVDQAQIEAGHRVLDVGCGTGTLALLVKQLHPTAEVIGLDPDPRALALAERKARRRGVSVRFERGFADEIAHPDGSFDRVFSSFMLHHLQRGEKLAALGEIRRVLSPAGSLHVLDFGPPHGAWGSVLARVLHRSEILRDNLEARIPGLMRESGLSETEERTRRQTLFGSISYYAARP